LWHERCFLSIFTHRGPTAQKLAGVPFLWSIPFSSAMDSRLTDELVAAYWALVDKSQGEDGCWPWTGPMSKLGTHGRFSIPGLSSNVVAHHFAYELAYGRQPQG